jgi:hypothetical protein
MQFLRKLLFVQTKDGDRKLGPLAYILGAAVLILPAVMILKGGGAPILKGEGPFQGQKEKPNEFQTPETDMARKEEMPNTAIAEIERQIKIAEEQGSGIKVKELEARKAQIIKEEKDKVEQDRKSSAQINFQDRLGEFNRPKATPPPAPAAQTTNTNKNTGFMSFADRMAAEGKKGNAANSKKDRAMVFENGTNTPSSTIKNPETIAQEARNQGQKPKESSPTNILPLGTFLPAVLDADVITTDLQPYVWATLATDVTFRRQLQLPLGLVKIRGKAAREPVQNLLDVVFDVMVFSDGTELPIQGFAYSAFDIRYPDRFRVRGIPGKLVTPPLYVTLTSMLLQAGLGASDAFIQNYLNEQTTTDSTFNTVPSVDPTTGQVTTVLQQSQGQPVNNNIGASVGLSAAQAAAEQLAGIVGEKLEEYRPYVKVEKGYPFFIQLDSTINISDRKINGFAIKAAEEEKARRSDGTARAGEPDQFPPGDARYRYDGRSQTPSIFNPVSGNQNAQAGVTGTTATPTGAMSETDLQAQVQALQTMQQREAILNQYRSTMTQPSVTGTTVPTSTIGITTP